MGSNFMFDMGFGLMGFIGVFNIILSFVISILTIYALILGIKALKKYLNS